jgi:tRNA A-37 threonylcarbamoyl transferase component Bud32
MNLKNNETYIKNILSKFYDQDFELIKIIDNKYSCGTILVKNNKLGGRYENIKFLESFEENTVKKFRKEVNILSIINHPNIPKVYDFLTYKDIILFRSEHVEGYTLEETICMFKNKGRSIPVNTATIIIEKITKALYHVHNEMKYNNKKTSIYHCDIKPSNIILKSKNQDYKRQSKEQFIKDVEENRIEPYLIDFGISRLKGDRENKSNGTLHYLSPWQVNNNKIDWRSDIYQVFLVYLEILTLKKPFNNLSRNKIIDMKKKGEVIFPKDISLNIKIKKIIERGTCYNNLNKNGYKDEKECLKNITKIKFSNKRQELWEKYRKKIGVFSMIVFLIFVSVLSYNTWDSKVNSMSAILDDISQNDNPSRDDLDIALDRLQKRSFEKKYLNQILEGKFRDDKTLEPKYPVRLNINGEWMLEGANSNSAGAFSAMLFEMSEDYPELLPYAKEYIKPIITTKMDGSNMRRYSYSIVAGYRTTKDEFYLEQLEEVGVKILRGFNLRSGLTQIGDIYYTDLFILLDNYTSNENYLKFYEEYVIEIINNNIDDDGFVYESALTNFSIPSGTIINSKSNRLVSEYNDKSIGKHLPLDMINIEEYKKITSVLSRDYAKLLESLNKLYSYTNNSLYNNTIAKLVNNYKKEIEERENDYLFISTLNKKNDIPKDTLATIRFLEFFKDYDKNIYYEKLNNFLKVKNFRNEHDKLGIVTNSVFINGIEYNHQQHESKKQTLIITDREFLTLN